MPNSKQRRHASELDHSMWREAVARYRQSEACYRPIRAIFERMEDHCLSHRHRDSLPGAEDDARERQMLMVAIEADEGRYLRAWCAATREVLNTRAPDLADVIWKLELVREIRWDEDIEWMILADLKRLHARHWAGGRRP